MMYLFSFYPAMTKITIIFIALLLAAFLSASEQALKSVSKNNLRQMAEEGSEKAERAMALTDKPYRFLSAYMICIVFFGFIVISCSLGLAEPALSNYAATHYDIKVWIIGIIGSVLAGACVYMVLGIFYPRQIAMRHAEGILMKMSGFMRFFAAVCFPFTALNKGISALLLKITGQGGIMREEEFSEEEVMSMLEAGQESGALKEEGKKMIDQIFAFDDKLAYEIMTPRTDVFLIDIQDDKEEYTDELMEMHYSRIPVCDGDSDNIIGILNIKDYMIEAHENGFENVDIKKIIREPVLVPDTKKIDSLFLELQKDKQHIAILIDEYGGFSGIVTMEDIVEEIVGDIDDEFDEEEPEIEKISDTVFYIDGSMDLDDVNEETGSQLESEDNETVGGLIIELLGEIPEDGSSAEGSEEIEVEYENYKFTVESVRDRRIERVRMEILPIKEKDEDDSKSE